MSTDNKEADMMMCCACCGIAQVDDVKLKNCDGGCDLVKYCSDACQDNHREEHEKECKKRLAELRDRDLFTQPDESHLGDCQICCLPLPLNLQKFIFMNCCSKYICMGCNVANQMRELKEGLDTRCVFCRETAPKTQEEADKRRMNRVKKNDPAAMYETGKKRCIEGDYDMAIEYWTKAAELCNARAHYNLSCLYRKGEGVVKDVEKEVYHLEEAAIGGHPEARHNLGVEEWNNGRFERARKHYIIAANLGYHDSLQCVKDLYVNGHASKEDYADAMRAYQAAVEEAKSAEREEAEAFHLLVEAAQLS